MVIKMLCQKVIDEVDLQVSGFALDSTPIFGAMNPAQVAILWSKLKQKRFPLGELIFKEGALPTNIYIVVEGEIEFTQQAANLESHVDTYTAHDAFGLTSLIGIQTQAGSAKVTSTNGATLLVLDRETLMFLQSEQIEIFSLLMMNIARHVSRKYHDLLEVRTQA